MTTSSEQSRLSPSPPQDGTVYIFDDKKFFYRNGEWATYGDYQSHQILIDALEWIATVNAMDYEYVRVARNALDTYKERMKKQ